MHQYSIRNIFEFGYGVTSSDTRVHHGIISRFHNAVLITINKCQINEDSYDGFFKRALIRVSAAIVTFMSLLAYLYNVLKSKDVHFLASMKT